MRIGRQLPECIRTPDELKGVVRRLETLASVLRMSGHPIAAMPPRDEMADAILLLCEYSRQTFAPEFTREFHGRRLRSVG